MQKLTLVFMVAACGGPNDPGLRSNFPGHPAAAADVDWADTRFAGAGGVQLYAQRWRPKNRDAKAVVVIHHGLDDHSSRYGDLATALVRDGYSVWSFDMRGHARSAGPRVSFDSVDQLLGDLDAFLALVRREEPGRKIFLYGHSLGGAVSSLYTIEKHPDIAGLVVVSPAIYVDAPPILAASIPVLASLAPSAPALDLPHRDFSQRADVVAEMDHDPLIFQRPAPARTARVVFQAASRIWAAPERLVVPLLAVHGAEDRAAAPAGSRDLVARAGSIDKTLRIYPGLRHDTLREPDGQGERVRDEILVWLDAHTGGQPVAYASSRPSHLLGDRSSRAVSVELDARDEQPRNGAFDEDPAVTGGVRLRFGAGRASALGIGYYGGLDARAGYVDGRYYEADLHAIGLSLRGTRGTLFAVTGGVGIGGSRGASATHLPLEVGIEVPAGAVRILGRASVGWRLTGDEYMNDVAGVVDEASAMLGVRIGRDHRYWAELVGGGGPYIAATYRDIGGSELIGIALGIDLFGSD